MNAESAFNDHCSFFGVTAFIHVKQAQNHHLRGSGAKATCRTILVEDFIWPLSSRQIHAVGMRNSWVGEVCHRSRSSQYCYICLPSLWYNATRLVLSTEARSLLTWLCAQSIRCERQQSGRDNWPLPHPLTKKWGSSAPLTSVCDVYGMSWQ